MTVPLVSCVMPTADRRAFVEQSIWYFLRQDYARRELIVVDDGDEAVAELIPHDERIRYVRLGARRPLGAKLNLACEYARGELVAHWDDDDWIGPTRLSRQVSALSDGGADACGLGDLLTYRLDTGHAWVQHPIMAAPGTLVYRKRLWQERPFEEHAFTSDADVVERLVSVERLRRLQDADTAFYVALIHTGNRGSRLVPGDDWTATPLSTVSERLGLDRDFYVRLRNGDAAPAKRSRAASANSLTVAASFFVYDGYGSMAEHLVRGLVRAGATVNVAPLDLDTDGLSEEFLDIFTGSEQDLAGPVLYFSWPRPDLERFRGAHDLFINTMWETSRLPRDWPARLNEARAVIVPSQFVAGVFRKSGVNVPIEVVPEGVDPEIYRLVERPERDGLTTLIVATHVQRKNTDIAVAAWEHAFEADPSARLIVKSRYGYGNYIPGDPRISLVDSNEPTRGITHWYAQADVLLALGSEGFGLPLVEGMATGLPVIALNSEGQRDVCADARGLLLPVEPTRQRPYETPQFGRCGVHGAPAVQDVAERLRWVARHPREAREMGRAAAEWVAAERDIWRKAPAVLDVMERRVRPARPLRRLWTMWVPSLGTPCGLAEHAAHLAEHLPGLELTASPPDLRGVRVLHVQHEPSLYDEGKLTALLQEANTRRIPVVVEEHAVLPFASAWERHADVLVATTARGQTMLRRRWRNKWIEHIPLGCPTWFPPRKRDRARVIGACGFLEPHKGFFKLLEILPRLPACELLLLSHDKHGALDKRWATHAAESAARRIGEFLPAPEIVRVLAAEADVLVFWYDEYANASASAAARLGLASGVPVLASPTGWFDDLRDVTHQPTDLAAGVEQLLDDMALREHLIQSARDFCHEHSWARTAQRVRSLWQALEGI